jgi:hypothetical protein
MKTQQYPFGYLSLLNQKSGGYTPTEVRDDVAPSLEMSPFLFAAIPLKSASSATATGLAVGTQAILTVPSGEAWEIIAAMAAASNGTAAQVLSYRLDIAPPDSSFPACAIAVQNPIAITNAGQEFSLPWAAPSGVILGPGTQFRARLILAMANNVDLVARALYRPLLI